VPGVRPHDLVGYECVGADAPGKPDPIRRTAYLYAGQDVAKTMTVEARLVVIHHPRTGMFPAFTEYRLMEAVRL
jgi:hypothetical protein